MLAFQSRYAYPAEILHLRLVARDIGYTLNLVADVAVEYRSLPMRGRVGLHAIAQFGMGGAFRLQRRVFDIGTQPLRVAVFQCRQT